MVHCSAWALLGRLAIADDEHSMLQMPIMEKTMQTEAEDSECRCPGYFQEQCQAEAAQGCVWTDAGSSNGPWCQCRETLEPGWTPEPRPPVEPQPPVEPRPCCRAMTADCLACTQGLTVEEYCQTNPDTAGCVAIPEPEPDPVICCRAMTADCLSCAAGVSVGEYCQSNPDTAGCEPVIIEPPSGEECCAPRDQRPAFCSSLNYLRAIGDGFTTDYTQVGTVYEWHDGQDGHDGACFEMHTGCCWFEHDLGCVACQHGVQPEEFCDENPGHGMCLTGEDCCVESPPEGCSHVLFPIALGHGFTTDYREVESSIAWSGSGCVHTDIFCCHWESLECAACQQGVLPEDLCELHGEDFPQYCLIIEPISPEECCVASPPEWCAGIDFERAIGHGMTTDYTEVGVEFSWHHNTCFEMATGCCWDMNDLGCVACANNAHPEDFCNDHLEEYPQVCLTGADCCVENPREECSEVFFNRASSISVTTDYREVHHTMAWTGSGCHEHHAVCCQAEDDMSCVACMNGILPEDFCEERGTYSPELCVGHIAVAGPPVHVLIDNSDSNEKCVTAPVGVICADDAGHLGNRINSHQAADTFEITVGGDNRDQVCARRTDSSGGWGMHLEIPCVTAPVHILIDNSEENRKCVTHSFPVTCAGDAGHLGNRINSHQAGDTFDITTSGNEVCAQRTDSSGGWGMHLEIACIAASHDEVAGQIVSAAPLNVLIDNSDANEKCVDAPYPVVCASDSGHLGNRVNTHQADDQFEITTDGSRVCARRLDHDGGWGMHLQVTCVAAPIFVLIGNSNDNRKCASAPFAVQCADDAGHLGNRVNAHTAGDTFQITSGGQEVCATRTDSAGGWGMQLEIVCVAIEPPITGEDYSYVGCFKDDHHRDLQSGPMAYGYTSVTCNDECTSLDFRYFALQNNGWCVCGNAYGTESQYSQVGDHECGGVCAGDDQLCGAGWRNAVYRTSVP